MNPGGARNPRAAGSAVRLPDSPRTLFLFNVDSDRNCREQFLLT